MILVTGATGFLGSHLLLHLLVNVGNDLKIRALYRNIDSQKKVLAFFEMKKKSDLFQKIIWFKSDILDLPKLEIAFADVEFVYHCAAVVSFDPSDEAILRKCNIEGTSNILNCSLAFGVKKFCYVSSIAALGDLAPNQTVVNEKTEWNPEIGHSDYAISKFGAEMEVWRAQQEGLDVIVVNPGVIIGETIAENWDIGSCKIFEIVAKGLKFYTKGITGFVSATDVVRIMHQLMESQVVNQKFVLISENWSYEKFSFEIATQFKVAVPKYHIKKWQTNVFWRMDWLFSILFFKKRMLSKSMANSLHSKDFYDNSKIKKTLDFEFEPLKKTIESTVKVYFSQSPKHFS